MEKKVKKSDPRQREGHRKRLREKFLKYGLDKFTDEEVIELLLTIATPRRDCKPAARALLKKFGGLAGVLEAPVKDLSSVEGVGPTNAFGLRFVHEVARKFLRDRLVRGADYLDSFDAVLEYFTHALRDNKVESFHVLFLNSQNAIIHEECLSVGSATHVAMSPRMVVERAISVGAAVIVMAHNHPGGKPKPSREDQSLTKELVFTARLLDLFVRDHIIISKEGYFSFWQDGLMKKFEREFDRFHHRIHNF